MLNIVGRKSIWFTLSGILVGLAVVSIAVFGFHESAEFKGGTLWQFSIPNVNASLPDVQAFFTQNLGFQNAQISFDPTNSSYLARLDVLDEATHQKDLAVLKSQWPTIQELS